VVTVEYGTVCGDFCYSVAEKGFKYLSELTGVEITENR